jgi:hypothetical protein
MSLSPREEAQQQYGQHNGAHGGVQPILQKGEPDDAEYYAANGRGDQKQYPKLDQTLAFEAECSSED